MIKTTVTFVLLLFLALSVASTSAASETTGPSNPLNDLPTGVAPAADHLLLATLGGEVNWSCVGTIAGITAFGLIVGAATGGAGLAIAGAYAPIAVVVCT